MSVQVLASGLLSTLQDAGREGYRALGVSVGGAADRAAYRLGQWLVGHRAPLPAALEITLRGPILRFEVDACIALTGAPIEAELDGQPAPLNRPFALSSGSTLRLGRVRSGCRSYLAVAGGWAVDPVLGSASTDLRAGFGGHLGRALHSGDRLLISDHPAAPPPRITPAWHLLPSWTPRDGECSALRWLSDAPADWLQLMHRARWKLSAESNRQGLRLLGAALPALPHDGISAPVLPGDVQLPPSGEPLLLGVDAQTVGGYALAGSVIDADLDRLAQLPPNAPLRLLPVSRREALRLARAREAELARAELAIAARISRS